MKTIFFLVIILFIIGISIYQLNKMNNQDIKNTEGINDQKFNYPEAKKSWDRAHFQFVKDADMYSYYSFDGAYKVKSKDVFFPKTVKEIQKIVKDNQGRKIRASGGHHTFNDISISNDIIVRTTLLKKILNLDKEKGQIIVESGITLDELNIYLQKNGLSISILPAIPYQCIAGALSTSSHGSTYKFGSMASMIIDMQIVKSDGSIVKIKKGDYEFEAVMTNLGCLGVIYSITLQCEPLFAIKHIRKIMKIKDFLNDYEELQKKYEFLQAYMWPFKKGEICTVYMRERIDLQTKDYDKILEEAKKTRGKGLKITRTDFSHKVLTKNLEASMYTEIEIGVPLKNIKEAVMDTIQLHKEYKEKHGYDTKYSILVRFTNADKDSLLSMASGRDTVFIDLFNNASLTNDPTLNKFFKAFEDLMYKKYNGRPHYGKKNYLTNKKMKKLYGINLEKFNEIKKSMDPQGMFTNDYIKRLLG